MANQELYKLENAVRKAETAWDRQMKRDGHLKKESRDISTAEPARMTPTARAFYIEYRDAKELLDAEAVRTDLFGRSAADGGTGSITGGGGAAGPDTDKTKDKGKKGGHLQVVTHSFPKPEEVITPDDMPRKIVDPATYADYKALVAEGLTKDKPVAKVVALDDQHFVVVQASDEHYLVLNRCIPEDQFTGTTIPNLADRAAGEWDGLLFKSGPGKSPAFVMLNSSQSIACVQGDPLANVKLEGDQNAASQ